MNILRGPRAKRRSSKFFLLRTASISLLAGSICSQVFVVGAVAQAAPPEARPIVFVHGWCSSANDWTYLSTIIAGFMNKQSGLYPNTSLYTLYYDGQTVRVWPTGVPLSATSVPASARFFAIEFSDPASLSNPNDFSPTSVAQVSVLNKGDELAQVIEGITSLTLVKDVVVIAHSLGGLDSRAYLENWARPFLSMCSDQISNFYSCLQTNPTFYTQDIYKLITLDTPHGGAVSTNFQPLFKDLGFLDSCSAADTLNLRELEVGSPLVDDLNSFAYTLPSSLTLASVESFTYPGLIPPAFAPDDAVVTSSEQSFGQSITTYSPPPSTFYDVPNSFSPITEWDCIAGLGWTPLHKLSCLGIQNSTATLLENELQDVLNGPSGEPTSIAVQATFNGSPWIGSVNYQVQGKSGYGLDASTIPSKFYNVPLDTYSVSYISGGPSSSYQISPATQVLQVDHTTGNNYWNLTFTLNFTSSQPPPVEVATLQAADVVSDGAVFAGTVNPEGGAATSWFEVSTNSNLQGYQSTPAQSVQSGTNPVSVTFTESGLESNTNYYYALVASTGNGAAPVVGNIEPFQTLSTLPAPSLNVPSNGSTNIIIPPTFGWNPVGGAFSYRLIVATNPGALPTDPTVPTCGSGCILNTTPEGATYTPPSIFAPSTVYYWEVHARSPQQYGNWSPIFSFTTASPTASSLTISPSTVVSGASTTVTVTLSGPAPSGGVSVALSPTNNTAFPLPPTILVPAGSSTASISVQAGTVTTSTTITVSASYGNSSTNAAVTVSPVGGSGVVLSSLTITPSTIAGGLSPVGIVALTGPAPATGALVSLSSNNTHFVQVPASQNVNVLPGFTSAMFPITTSFTSGTVGATIDARYNSTTYLAALTVLPVIASSVTFDPSSVDAGSLAPLTVYLNGPAPAGTSVSLTSSAPSVLQVQGSVPVPTGATSVSVTGTTFGVNSQTNVTVIATYNGGSAQGSLTVVPLSLTGFSLTPLGVTGGSSVTGTVWLSDIAPSGGLSVSLTSTSTLVQVPATVDIPAGSSLTNFAVSTSPVTSVTYVTVTAAYSGIPYNLTLTLAPPTPYLASLTFSPNPVDSGYSAVGMVTLTSPAFPSGADVSLTSSFSAVTDVPRSVNVPSGATSATFTVPTAPIGFISPVTVTATYNSTTQSSLLVVVPPGTPLAPGSLTLSPLSVTGGYPSTATVLLTGPAPTGGASLALTSDNAAVQVPPVVTVPAGLKSATFTTITSSVTNIETATVKATYDGFSESSLLTVEPAGTKPIGNPVPFLSAPLEPTSQIPGGLGTTLTLAGSGFVSGAQAWWNKIALPTTFLSSDQLQVSVPPAEIQENGTAIVTVTNPGVIDASSNGLPQHLTYSVATPSFSTSSITADVGSASVVVCADLNGDGNADLLIGGGFGNATSIFLGTGNGTFGPELLLQGAASAIVVGDFNGDGKPDIGTVGGNGSSSVINIFLGNGDGTFTGLPSIVLPNGVGGRASLAAADLNGDGYLDLVVTGVYLVQAYVLLGNGDGTFGAPTSFGSVTLPYSLAVADFNGDGKLDLALSDFDNQAVAILLGNGNGTFQSQMEYPLSGHPYDISVADFNGDGYPDLAIATTGGGGFGLSILRNNGNGTFALPVSYGTGIAYYSVSTDDVNGDGKLDLLVTDGQEGHLYLGNGDGTFATNSISIPMGQSAAAIADLNGDGAADIVVPNQTTGINNVTILLQSVAPVLQVTPSSLSFTAVQGQGAPPAESVAIANTGGGTETWSATASQPWVSLGQNTGTAPSTPNVSVNPAGLTPGTYPATITISAPGASNSPQAITVTLVVNPAVVVDKSLAFSPTTITGAGTTTGTVTLSGSAPTGGATIAFSTNNSVLQVPPIVTVPVGLASANFMATATAATSQTIVTVTATYNGVSTTATVTLNPNTIPLNVSPTSLPYGNQGIASASAAKKVTITNNTGAVVTISSIGISGTNPTDFAQSATTCGNSLAVKGSCTLSIAFTPTALGARSAALILQDSAANSPQTIALSGTGVLQASLAPVTLAFGSEAEGSVTAAKTATLTNNTSAALPISSVATTGTNASEFTVSSNACGVSVASHSSCKISVTFAPVTPGAKTASLTITDSANNSPQSVSLSGTGIAPVSITPVSLTFAAQKAGTTSAGKNVRIKNNLKTTLIFSGIAVTGPDARDFSQSATTCGGTLGAGLTCTVSITFTPTAKGSRTADLSISDSAITSPQIVVLSGTGK